MMKEQADKKWDEIKKKNKDQLKKEQERIKETIKNDEISKNKKISATQEERKSRKLNFFDFLFYGPYVIICYNQLRLNYSARFWPS